MIADRDDLVSVTARLFPGADWRSRLQRLRPRICPFELIVNAVPHGASVLDIGCGSGLLLGLLISLDRVSTALGVDMSPQAIDAALAMRSRLPADARDRLSFDCRSEQDASGVADVVTMIDVMHHIPPSSQHDAFVRAARLVRPGGLFVYKDIGGHPLWRGAANRLHDLVLARQLVHYVDARRIDAWRLACGLELVEWGSHSRLWYQHEFGIFRKPALTA